MLLDGSSEYARLTSSIVIQHLLRLGSNDNTPHSSAALRDFDRPMSASGQKQTQRHR
jgi:hypothetical protein